jgi:hypothetical protein
MFHYLHGLAYHLCRAAAHRHPGLWAKLTGAS